MTLSIILIILFVILSLAFYLTRKFKWYKVEGEYFMSYKGYFAGIESYMSDNNLINAYVYKNGECLYYEEGCSSVSYAKDIVEQTIIEDEYKCENINKINP